MQLYLTTVCHGIITQIWLLIQIPYPLLKNVFKYSTSVKNYEKKLSEFANAILYLLLLGFYE